MSQNNSNNTDQTTSLNLVNTCEETVLENLAKLVDDTLTDMKKCLDKVLDLRGTVLENLAKFVDDTLTDMKKCLDKVLDLRVQTAELEVNLTMLYNPYLLNSLEESKDIGTLMTNLLQEDSVENS